MKKINLFVWTIVLLCVTTFSSCNSGALLPSATGTPSEVLVVASNNIWNSNAGKALDDVLDSDVVGLPQSEPNFKVSRVTPGQFDNILKPVRNIFIIEVDSSIYTQAKFTAQYDVWAKDQAVLYLRAADNAQLDKFVKEQKQTIIDFFVFAEINRTVKNLKKNHHTENSKKIQEQFLIDILVPDELKLANQKENFFWASNGEGRGRMDMAVYTIPYTDINQFTLEKIIATRDSVMAINIPGGKPGQYMSTQSVLKPELRILNVNGAYVAEVRGLWEMKNDMMGGPFVSQTRLDEANQRLIVTEVFAYAPERDKRNMMRRLEGALFSLKLPQDVKLREIEVLGNFNTNQEQQ